jgi:hypothetical protein
LLLLSPSDLSDPAAAFPRIERLYHQSGGRYVGTIFLLHEKATGNNGTIGYMNLQARYGGFNPCTESLLTATSVFGAFDIPILPIYSIASFQKTVDSFRRQISGSTRPDQTSSGKPAALLLPYCTLCPPIQEYARNILGEEYHTLAEIAQAATTTDGQVAMRALLSDQSNSHSVAEEVIDFWAQEYCTG